MAREVCGNGFPNLLVSPHSMLEITDDDQVFESTYMCVEMNVCVLCVPYFPPFIAANQSYFLWDCHLPETKSLLILERNSI